MPKNAAPIILSLAYILGLLATAVPWGGMVMLTLGGMAAIALPRFWKGKLSPKIWIVAGVVGLFASLYFQIRLPQPGVFDISRLVETIEQKQTVTASGMITEMPRLTRNGNAQIWLDVNRVDGAASKIAPDRVRGNLYATVPLLQATGLHPGQTIALTGSLYKPKPATNPGGFDFQAYLAQSGCFAGLKGRSLEVVKAGNPWGWWAIRQKIVRSQIDWLGSPEGQLVSAMVLGGRVVDLPFDIKDQFVRIGLCHALAASGFQVSLILGVVLELTKRFSERIQVGFGASALLIFLGLTGLQPAVLRAVIMGGGLLIGLATKRRVKPLSGLLLAAIILLLANPIWIWDLGFQLSFLATMGLQITVPPLVKRLDWLPTLIATLIAIPIAAYIWTLPLLLYVFGVVSPYSIPANIIVTPLISIISIGGIISALFALVSPIAGTVSAWLLHYPTYWLLTIVDFFCQLPGNAIAVGAISGVTLVILYTFIGLPWLRPQLQKHVWMIGLAAIALVFVPASYARATLFQATVLATAQDPILVIQDRGKVGLVNSGDEATVRSTLLPFLQKEGINAIDWAISTTSTQRSLNGWTTLLNQMPVKSFYQAAPSNAQLIEAVSAQKGRYLALSVGQRLKLQSTSVQPISSDPEVVQFQIGDQNWLWLKDSPKNQPSFPSDILQAHPVLWWSGQAIDAHWLETLKPKVAIAYSSQVDRETVDRLQTHQTQVYQTRQDGAIRWTGKQFEKTLGIRETDASPL
ncbi:ComEC/Rec2 family competence protein [Phormidesmis priestleyi]